MKCGDCKFWKKLKDEDDDGECRANPPNPMLVPVVIPLANEQTMGVNSFFPRTRPDIWCGQGVPRMEIVS